jgi:DNA-binding transcriptional LysR family regulator
MDRRSLEYFRSVAKLGSVTAAALDMSVTQPAVSKQIRRLEAEFAMKLFHRRPSGMTLTPAGEALYELGGDVLTRFERAEGTIRSRFSGKPAFRVACPPTTAFLLIAPFMVDADPAVVDLLMVPAPDVDVTLEREADLAISTLLPPPHRRKMVVGSLPVYVYGSSHTMHARFGDSKVGDLERLAEDLVLVPITGVHVVFDEATAHFDPPLRVRNVAMGFVGQALAANGHGFALATEQVAFGLRGLPAHVAGRPLATRMYASWDPQHYAAAELCSLARNFSGWLTATAPWGTPTLAE